MAKSKNARKLTGRVLATCLLLVIAIVFITYDMMVLNPAGLQSNTGLKPVQITGNVIANQNAPVQNSPTPTTVKSTGGGIYETQIDEQDNTAIFEVNLNEKIRATINVNFQQPVSLLVLTEPYYSRWLRDRQVRTYTAYVKNFQNQFSARFDINEGAGGIHYFIIQSQSEGIKGTVKIVESAKL